MAVASNRPNGVPDNSGSGGPSRSGKYSEGYANNITSKEMFSADEGSYFVSTTPTPGTGIITHAAPTTFDEAKAILVVYNGGQNRIYPQLLHLNETVAGAGGTIVQFTVTLDQGNRKSSAGTVLTPVNVNMDSTIASAAIVTFGAVVSTAASASRRLVGNYVFRSTLIDIIGDQYNMVFGAPDAFMSGQEAATLGKMSRALPPLVVGPGQSLCIHQWRGSQSTGPTFEVVFGFIER